MLTVLLVVVAIFGLIAGSFLNAVLYRYNTGRSALRGRSACMQCGHTLSVLDLVPLLSFIFLRGRCRYCSSKLSPQYPLVETAGAILAVLLYFREPDPLLFSLHFLLWLTLLFIVVYDLRHFIIPWSAAILLAVFALLSLAVTGFTTLALIAGPVLAAPLFILSLVSRGKWMGWGDWTLELGLGWLLGLTAGLTALCIAFWTGAVVGIILMFLSSMRRDSTKTAPLGGYTMKSEVPFAPFLIFGAACVYFFHVDLFQTLPTLFL